MVSLSRAAQLYFHIKCWLIKIITMKNSVQIISTIILSLFIITLSSCKKYLDINQNPNAAEEQPINGLLANTTYSTAYNVYSAGNITSYYTQYLASPNTAGDVDIYNTINTSDT
jgi:hypothetical protein